MTRSLSTSRITGFGVSPSGWWRPAFSRSSRPRSRDPRNPRPRQGKTARTVRLFDLIVLDAPAAGHAVTFLTSALGLLDAARGGPLRTQAQDVVEMLRDPARCQVMLVSLPEETPVNELIETAYRFEDQVGVALAPVVDQRLLSRPQSP